MEKVISLLFLLMWVCFPSSGADKKGDMLTGSGRIVTETRDSRTFNSIKISGAVRSVCMTDDTDGKIVIRADDNVMPYVKTIFDGYELIVRIDAPYSSLNEVSVDVDVPYSKSLRSLDVSGCARMATALPIESYELDIDLSGAAGVSLAEVKVSKFECDLSAASELKVSALNARECCADLSGASHAVLSRLNSKKCEIEMSGASNIDAAGVCEFCDLEASGASKFNASGFKVRNYKVDVSGSSDVSVKCTEAISGNVSGVSQLQCAGNPQHRGVSFSRTAKISYGK